MPPHFFLLPVYYFVIADIDRLSIRAEPAVATVSQQLGERRLIRLPELEFKLRIVAHCARGRLPESISISVADTRETIRGEQLPESGPLELSVIVASRQIAPLAVGELCVAGHSDVVVANALTAQVSLRCALDDEQSIVFDAIPLDVRISCASPPD